MAAYEIPNLRFSGEAGGEINRRRFVKINANEEVIQAAAGEAVVGVSSQPAKAGEVAEIYDGIVMVEAGAAIPAGSEIEVGPEARAIVLASGKKVGYAVTGAGAAGELLSVKL